MFIYFYYNDFMGLSVIKKDELSYRSQPKGIITFLNEKNNLHYREMQISLSCLENSCKQHMLEYIHMYVYIVCVCMYV